MVHSSVPHRYVVVYLPLVGMSGALVSATYVVVYLPLVGLCGTIVSDPLNEVATGCLQADMFAYTCRRGRVIEW